jgi:hypothetical protein
MQQQPQAMRQPSFAPLSATPAEAAYQKGLPIPQRQDYQAHGLHRVLNAIAGGFSGAAGHPEVGAQLAQRPYENAVANWQRQTGQLKTASDIDVELQRQGVQKAVAQTGAAYKDITAEQNQQKIDQNRDKLLSLHQRYASLENLRQQEIDLKKKVEAGKKNPEELAEWLGGLDIADPNERAIAAKQRAELWQEYKATKTPSQLAADEAAKKQADIDTQAKNLPTLTAIGAATSGAKAGATTEAQIAAKTSDENIEKQKKLKASIMAVQEATKISQQSKAGSEKAKIALSRYPDIMSQLSTASDKLFGNRFQDFLAGNLGKGAEEFEPLRLNIGLLQSIIAQIHVQRTGAVILHKFEGLFNAKQMDKDTLTAGLNELKKWLEAYAKNPNDPSLDTKAEASTPSVNPPGKKSGIDWSKITVVP